MSLNKANFNLISCSSCHVNPGHQSAHQRERHERLPKQHQLLHPGASLSGPASAPAWFLRLLSVISDLKDVVPARKTRLT